jgi:hypothetical protein
MVAQKMTGKVVKKRLSEGSKSDHEGVVLETKGEDYVLQRQGGNPFHDEVLEGLVGKTIDCEGVMHNYKFIITSWKEE